MATRRVQRPETGSPASRVMLWPGHGLYVGPLLPNALHSHHAVQITAVLSGRISAEVHGAACPRRGVAVIAADEPHALDGDAKAVQLYLDPHSLPGQRLSNLREPVRAELADRTSAELPAFRRLWRDGAPLTAWRTPVNRICGTEQSSHAAIPVDARVAAVLTRIHAAPTDPPTLADAAAMAQLSAGRFGHIFTQGTGLPYRRYLLWVRLIAAVAAIPEGASLTAIAHEVGFADQAHLTRTFRRMFGMAPSALNTHGVRVEIDLAGWAPAPVEH